MFNQGPTFFRKIGEGAEYKEHKARKVGGRREKLQEQYTPKFNVSRKKGADGTIYKTYKIDRPGIDVQPLRLAKIVRAVQEVVQETSCTFDSGFFDLTNFFSYEADGYFSRIAYKASFVFENSVDMVDGMGDAGGTNCNIALTKPDSVVTKMGSRFTGQMRKVVQMLAGQYSPIHYDFCWMSTHGIWVSPTSGNWWVIEISVLNGITAWSIPACEVLSDERQVELEVGEDVPVIPQVGTVPSVANRIRLAPASELSEYFSCLPFYAECGWAFSYDGSEAQNVVWSEPDSWKRAKRFKVAISGTTSPTSATVTKEEEIYLWAERYGGPKFPQYLPNGGGQTLLTFDSRSNPPAVGAPPGDYADAPIYVHYLEGKDGAIVWRMGSPDSVPDDEIGVSSDLAVADRIQCGSGPSGYFTEIRPGAAGDGVYGTYDKIHGAPRVYVPDGPLTSPIEDVVSWNAAGSYLKYSSEQDGSWFLHSPGGTNQAYSQHWLSYRDQISGADWSRIDIGGFIVPFSDREQVYLFRKVKEALEGTSTVRHTSGYGLGTWDTWRLNTSVPGPCTNPLQTPYRSLACAQPLPDMFYTADFARLTGGTEWCNPPIIYNMFGPGDGCYGTPDAHDTRVWCRTFATPIPKTSCPSGSTSLGAYEESIYEFQKLYVIDPSTGAFVEVKDWTEYEPTDAYTAIIEDISAGSQVMFSHPDAFTGAGFASSEMNGSQGDEYYYFASADNYYPLSTLTSGFDRGWFGVPF